jgi:hypothetical protein
VQLPQNSGLILVAVLTLALGVGASSWLFSMLRQWVIEAVSFSHPDQLAVLWKIDTRKGWTSGASALDFLDWRAQNSVFAMLSAWTPTEFNVTGAIFRNGFRARASVPISSARSGCSRSQAAISWIAKTSLVLPALPSSATASGASD